MYVDRKEHVCFEGAEGSLPYSVEVRKRSFFSDSWNCVIFWPLGEVKRPRVSSTEEALMRFIG